MIRDTLRTFNLTGWLIVIGLLGLIVALTLAWGHGRRSAEVDHAAEDQGIQTRAADGRETAAGERAADARAIQTQLDERNRDAAQTPDSPPDDRELRRRCRQLREAGTVGLPACRGFEG